jgi:protocatechuate 3,4-dioxygenase beta subunit
MKLHFQYLLLLMICINITGCNGQTVTDNPSFQQLVGGGCDGCELMYVGMPDRIHSVDTSAGWDEPGQKILIKGIVYKHDGKTPAADVIIYYWQTDNNGYYTQKSGMNESAKQHGFIRGWVKTDVRGNYAIYTIRPAPYPNAAIPAHIHPSIKEPNITNEYYIDDFVFDNDPLLEPDLKRNPPKNRGGSGILKTLNSGDLQIAERNIILGLNIPDYPETKANKK